MRVSTVDQHPETQLYDLQKMAEQRGYQIVQRIHGQDQRRQGKASGLGSMMADARHGHFDVVMVWASDRLARSVRHFLEVLDELSRLNIEFISFRENIDTGGPLGRAIVVIISAIAELERNLIVERVRAGMRRARLEGRQIGRRPLEVDRQAISGIEPADSVSASWPNSIASPAPAWRGCSRSKPCFTYDVRCPMLQSDGIGVDALALRQQPEVRLISQGVIAG